MFCYSARQDGRVVSKGKTGIIVEYADGTRKGVSLGRTYGKAEGSVYPQDVTTMLSAGDTFKKGANIAYNTGFFEPDFMAPGNIIYKGSMLVKTALWESNQTFEDSSSISRSLSKKMSASTTKVKSIVVDFKQNLIDVVKIGQSVHPKDILMVIEDEITSTTSYFDEESLSTLRKLSKQAPSSSYDGVVDRIEVYYHGDLEDMSASLRDITMQSDGLMSTIARSSGADVITGQVNEGYRVNGTPLSVDRAEIRVYITITTEAGVGDKGIFANQLKSVIGEVMDYDMHTESGAKIEAIFGYRSIAARIVTSPVVMGTTATLLKVIAQNAVKMYK
jgi:hypothetical protein